MYSPRQHTTKTYTLHDPVAKRNFKGTILGAVTLWVAANTLPGVQGPSVEAPSGAPQGVETGVEGVRVQGCWL